MMSRKQVETVERVAEAIAELRALTADASTSYETLLAKAHALVSLAPLSIASICEPGQEVYRGTNHHTAVPLHEREISYPPAACVQKYGRANCPGRPAFYCSTDPNGAFLEIGIGVGQYAVLAKWVTTCRMVVQGLGYAPSVFLRANARREPPEHFTNFDATLDEATRLAREFFAMEFTRPDGYDYRLTAALAEVYVGGDDIAGILYPTIAKDCNSDNLALLPTFADGGLRLIEARVVLVDQVDADGSVGGQVVANLEASTGGELKWKYTSTSSTVLRGKSTAVFRLTPGARSRVEQACEVTISGLTYRMEPGYSIELVDDRLCVRDLQGSTVKPIGGQERAVSFWPESYGKDVNQYIQRFRRLFAFAADIMDLRGTKVAVALCFSVTFEPKEHGWTITMGAGQGVELHEPAASADRIALAVLIHDILRAPVDDPAAVGMVVDASQGELDGMNARTEPVHGTFYLPAGFELVYGCRGSEKELAVNAALNFCRSEVDSVIQKLKRAELPELTEESGSALFKRVRRIAVEAPKK